MKQYFLYILGLLVPLIIVGWFLYLVGRAFYSLYQDRQLNKELDELQAGAEARRQERARENERRLANGCTHDFESPAFGLPPQVCRKCGLEREKPAEACDHVWKLRMDAISSSYCEKCGKKYRAADHAAGWK
jgi:hypothetical protein